MRTFGTVLLAALMLPVAAMAAPPRPAPSVCEAAIAAAEQGARVLPPKLMDAIALVESGRYDADRRAYVPWPWTIDVGGTGYFFDTEPQAAAAVAALQAKGVKSIDVGCMQVNLMHHPDAFASLDDAFDPKLNAAYAARFLTSLYRQSRSWPLAAAAYHSSTPDIALAYEQRVMAIWPLARRYGGDRVFAHSAGLDPQRQATSRFAARLLADAAARRLRDAAMRGPALASYLRPPASRPKRPLHARL